MPATSSIAALLEIARDKFTGFISQISGDHRYIHEGKAFSVIGNTGEVAAAGTYSLSLRTPVAAKGYVHLRPAVIAASANVTSFVVTEGATVTGGNAATPINLNRNVIKVSDVSVTAGVTVSAAGTVIYQAVVGAGGATPARSGGQDGAEHERVLMPDTVYSLTFTVIGATTASIGYFDIFWYEEEK